MAQGRLAPSRRPASRSVNDDHGSSYLKRTELQVAACRAFGKQAAGWTGRATNEELREALISGEVPAKFAKPDCFAARVRSDQVKDLRSRKVLRMVVNVGARGSVSADTFFARGAAAVTLVEALERAGVRVQVDMLSLATNGVGREIRIACRLKEAGEVIQLDKLAFCLAHPSLHRKLNFALRLKHAGWIGGSIDVPLDQRGDIYIDAADSTATGVWLDPVKAQQWVLAQLKAQGITMRAA